MAGRVGQTGPGQSGFGELGSFNLHARLEAVRRDAMKLTRFVDLSARSRR